MLLVIAAVCAAVQIVGFIASIVALVVSVAPTPEELERASMRSLSWPTKEVA